MQLGWAMHSIKLSGLYEAARTGTLRLGPYLQEPTLNSTSKTWSRSSSQTHLSAKPVIQEGSCSSAKAVSKN
jgi:hypothetical protein